MSELKLLEISDLIEKQVADGKDLDFDRIHFLVGLVKRGHDVPSKIINYVFEEQNFNGYGGVDSSIGLRQLDENYWSCVGFLLTSSYVNKHKVDCDTYYFNDCHFYCNGTKIFRKLSIQGGGGDTTDYNERLRQEINSLGLPPRPPPPPPDHLG